MNKIIFIMLMTMINYEYFMTFGVNFFVYMM